jgi:hypothetical protein
MKIQRTTTTEYSLNIKEISKAVLQSMNLQTAEELGMKITVSYKEDPSEISE